ncbi:uroporphyrinogen-III synthase [Microbulbifer sp. THAF38]|uniref:uroporphyrinogen-III synthase n=1 Tax=Microbulbifer sp. THAF38 TaxID=2587856 RepID=UPI001268C1A0|nr:uroporphyrinogen-III synthase [Microbulbifer sp. THAF38]QFT53154.1 Uroporphyrinogen-III synthase [Microbulbifer sp. THAF38]
MAKSLHNKRILTTRPAHQADTWDALLCAEGATVDSIPMLAIAPLTEGTAQQAIKKRILDFDQVDFAIFVSQNAVRYAVDWLEDYWPQIPQGPRYFAIGAATAKALLARGISCEHGGEHMNSEDLLAQPALQEISEQRVLIFRGAGGRTLIGDTLRARGARVDYCELYRRCLPTNAPADLAQYAFAPDAITVHSGETLANLHTCIERSNCERLLQAALICPSARVAEQARALGFTHAYTALNAGDSAMLEALLKALG